MNFKEKLEKAKEFLFNEAVVEETVETVEAKFIEAELLDGGMLSIEPDVELGASVSITTEEGVELAPDGTHELADGRSIVTEAGVIIDIIDEVEEAIEEAVEEIVEETEMSTEEVAPVTEPTPKTVIERTEVERKFEAMSKEIEDLKNLVNEFSAQLNEKDEAVRKDVFSALEEIGKEPVAETTNKKFNPFKKERKENKLLIKNK